ncbi:MAG: hypothetical protein WKF84_09720 [Pyrinomonadaceae bacterium]
MNAGVVGQQRPCDEARWSASGTPVSLRRGRLRTTIVASSSIAESNGHKFAPPEQQRNRHWDGAMSVPLRLERHCHYTGISWLEAKHTIVREAVRNYLAHPLYTLISTAQLLKV